MQETCEGFDEPNSVSAVINLDAGGTEPLQNSPTGPVSVTIPPNSRYCDSEVTVTKQFDADGSGSITAGDTFISGWGMTLVCNGEVAEANTDGSGTVVFIVPGPGIEDSNQFCTLTEDTVVGVSPVGRELNGVFGPGTSADFVLEGDTFVTVEFLNDPGDEQLEIPTIPDPNPTPPTSTTPGATPDVTETETPTPDATETPEPTSTVPTSITPPTSDVEEPTSTPTPDEDSGVGSEGPDDGSNVGDATPGAPDSGTGLASRSNRSATMMLFVAALLFVSGALGTFVIADRHK